MNTHKISVDSNFDHNSYFGWSWDGRGFGQLRVNQDPTNGLLFVENECMSRDSVRHLLHAYADYIADRAILVDNPEDAPLVDLAAEIQQQKDRLHTRLNTKLRLPERMDNEKR
jgi:hypothetical protein